MLAESICKVLGTNYIFEISEKNTQETSSNSHRENRQKPYMNAEGENPQEPSQDSEGKNTQEPSPSNQIVPVHIDEIFLLSDWYENIVHFLINFECPTQFSRSQ